MRQQNDPDRANSRRCDRADELSEEQSSKKQGRKRSRHDHTVDDEQPSKRPRCNGKDSSFSSRKTSYTADAIPTGRSMRGRKLASDGKPELTSGKDEM